MLEYTLLKTLYHEMDPEKISDVREFDNEKSEKYREIFLDVPGYPEIKTLISEVSYGSHNSALYYVHCNGQLEQRAAITDARVKAAIFAFFKKYQPEFLLENLPEDISDISILDCFDITKIPDYRPKYAFPGIVMLEDIRSGKVKPNDPNMPAFPGLRLLGGEEKKDNRPAYVSNKEDFTEFNGNNDDFQKKMEEMKKQFNIDALLNNK